MAKAKNLLQQACIGFVKLYRYLISPVMGNHCRFQPSCSSYAVTAIERFGILKGFLLTGQRLLCCHPWHTGGYDPVPQQEE